MILNFLLIFFLSTTMCLPIGDLNIQNKAYSPALGKGFNYNTGEYYSICMEVPSTTEPSYDVNFKYKFFETSSVSEAEVKSSFEGSLGYSWFKAKAAGSASTQSTSKKRQQYLFMSMTVDSYYASVNDIESTIAPEVKELLSDGEVVSFFQSCGPSYIENIRRRSEVVVVFNLKSNKGTSESEVKAQMSAKAGFGPWSASVKAEGSAKKKRTDESLEITIDLQAFGMSDTGSDGFITAQTIEDLREAMEHCYDSMKNPLTGQVISVNTNEWVNNYHIQKLLKENESFDLSTPEKKIIAVENSEYLSTTTGNLKTMRMLYTKATSCTKALADMADNSELMNHMDFGRRKTVGSKKVSEVKSAIQDLKFKEKFNADIKPHLSACFDELLKPEVFTEKMNFEIPECVELTGGIGDLTIAISQVTSYCSPQLV